MHQHPLLGLDRAGWNYTQSGKDRSMRHASGAHVHVSSNDLSLDATGPMRSLWISDVERSPIVPMAVYCPIAHLLPDGPEWVDAVWAALDAACGPSAVQAFEAAYARVQPSIIVLGATGMVSIERAPAHAIAFTARHGSAPFLADPELVSAATVHASKILAEVAHISVPSIYTPTNKIGHWTHTGECHWKVPYTRHQRMQVLQEFQDSLVADERPQS